MVMLAAWRRLYDGKADRASLPEAWQGVIQSWTVSLSRTRSEQEPAYLEIHNTYTSVPEDPSVGRDAGGRARVEGHARHGRVSGGRERRPDQTRGSLDSEPNLTGPLPTTRTRARQFP